MEISLRISDIMNEYYACVFKERGHEFAKKIEKNFIIFYCEIQRFVEYLQKDEKRSTLLQSAFNLSNEAFKFLKNEKMFSREYLDYLEFNKEDLPRIRGVVNA